MNKDELKAAAQLLYDRGVTEGPGPLIALANRIRVRKNNFYNWTSRNRRIPEVVGSYVEDLVRWSDALEGASPKVRRLLLSLLRKPE